MAMLLDPLVSESVTKLSELVIYVASTTANFKPQLKQLIKTLQRIEPIFDEIEKLNRKLDRTKVECDLFINEIEDAGKLVQKCLKIKRNFIKKFKHSLKLTEINDKLLRFFQIEVQADQSRDIKKTLVQVNHVTESMSNMALNMNDMQQTLSGLSNSVCMSWSREHLESELDREKLGWPVPIHPKGIVAFEKPLENLKLKVLDGIHIDDGDSMEFDDDGFDGSSVLVVAAAGGCGKTTLVTMLCYHPDIKAKFGENIFFVTVSESPDLKVIVNNLFNPSSNCQQLPFQSDEDAKNKLGNYFHEKASHPVLVVLDDVWSDSFIENFLFRGCRILVTSRTAFPKYDVFRFDPLSEEDSKILFRRSARPSTIIKEDLVDQMVKCCKKHPLTLSVIGRSLNGRDVSAWKSMLRKLSECDSVLDLNEEVRNRLEKSFENLDDELKKYYLDLGLFPEDQRIPASILLDMWVHLYNHDDEGNDTLAKIFELSYRNLVDLMATGLRKDSEEIVNYCDQQFVKQHDLLRELAIHLSSKEPVAQRRRLIINARGEDLPISVTQVQEDMQASILSISTGGLFSLRWGNMKAPNVEVLVLNLTSETYTLPHFLEGMQHLTILNITNYGLYPTEFRNSHLLGFSHNLTRVRLERVAISSLSRSLLALVNLKKVSLIMCKIGNAFEKFPAEYGNPGVWPQLEEIEIDYCQDLEEYPGILCRSSYLKKLSVTNCNEMCGLSEEEFGNLASLETLSLRSCTKLEKLPEGMARLQKLSVLNISDCLSLRKLPEQIGKLADLRTIYMKGCTGIHELPPSVEELSNTLVVCNEEISYQWREFRNVKIDLVEEEDRLETLMRII